MLSDVSSSARTEFWPSALTIGTACSTSRSDMALAPLRALTGLSVRRERSESPRVLPRGALAHAPEPRLNCRRPR
eukprot:1165751-Pyramimonas_sp.AAC.1